MEQVIGNPIKGVRTRKALKETCEFASYISQMKPKNNEEAELEESLIKAFKGIRFGP